MNRMLPAVAFVGLTVALGGLGTGYAMADTPSGSASATATVTAPATATVKPTPTHTIPLPTILPTGDLLPDLDDDGPSVAQVCAATSVDQVDNLLRDAADSDVVDKLHGLLSVGVPHSESPEVDDSVQLADIKKRLNCDKPAETTTMATTSAPSLDDITSHGGFKRTPRDGVDTGGGPA